MLLSGERIDQLYADDIQIIQSKEVFSFSIDAVLLANFPQLPKRQDCRFVSAMARSASSLVGKQRKDRPNRITTSFGRYGSTKYSIK